MSQPLFSIVIPLFNRPREIRRAIESCLAQDFTDFELIVVDDASQDNSADVVKSYPDPRLKLIIHEKNQGECPARNTGAAAATGEWIIFIDSDHALKPAALARIQHHLDSSDRLGFMQEWDNGIVTPTPAPTGQLLDYYGWLHFIESATLSDFLLVTRRHTFESVRWPDSTVAPTEYHLDFAQQFTTRLIPETLAIQYTDSTNRLTASLQRPKRQQLMKRASHEITSKHGILARHGEALRAHAPRIHELTYRVLILSYFIQRQWGRGLKYAFEYFVTCRVNWSGAGSIALAGIWTEGFLRLRHQRMLRGN